MHLPFFASASAGIAARRRPDLIAALLGYVDARSRLTKCATSTS